MQVNTEKHTRFADELRFIPRWAWVLAGLIVVCAPILFVTVLGHDPKAPPFWARVPLGILCGVFMGCYVLLIGYVNRDAGRRGMNRIVWTLLAVFVPNGLGIILYFLLRQALPCLCQRCGAQVQSGYGYCPKCGTSLTLHCSRCQQAVQVDDVYCPHCGNPVHAPDASLPAPQPQPK
jgi:RNA polymerase subunit RPABC4/transcription elongation factor Spt4